MERRDQPDSDKNSGVSGHNKQVFRLSVDSRSDSGCLRCKFLGRVRRRRHRRDSNAASVCVWLCEQRRRTACLEGRGGAVVYEGVDTLSFIPLSS